MPAATTDEGKSSSFFLLSDQLCPSLCHQFLHCQAALPGSGAAGAGAVPSGEETTLLRSEYQRYRSFILSLQKLSLTQVMAKLDDHREIQGSWRDPHTGSRPEPRLVWRKPYSGKPEDQTHSPCYRPHSSSVQTQCCCDESPFHQLLLPGCFSWVCGA